MAYLFCENDGVRKRKMIQAYEGETTLVTRGPLVMEDCECDGCGKEIEPGKVVYLFEFLVKNAEDSQANAYLDLDKANVEVIRAEPSGVTMP